MSREEERESVFLGRRQSIFVSLSLLPTSTRGQNIQNSDVGEVFFEVLVLV